MEHIDELINSYNAKCKERRDPSMPDYKLIDNGTECMVPYHIIKEAVISGISSEELKDRYYAARLQYRLMLLNPVIKATVNFAKLEIKIIYNSTESKNKMDKMSLDELIEFLNAQGIHVDKERVEDKDFDYFEYYKYEYNPKEVRSVRPYGVSAEEWEKRKPAYIEKVKKSRKEKFAKFKEWQKSYTEANKEHFPEYS
ncbi:MAG: hypothetical protein ACP5RP_00895 [Candidatus Micrarchaeia archaeon]